MVALPGLPRRTGAVESASVPGRRTARKIAEIAAGGNGMTRIGAAGTVAAMIATEAITGRKATTATTATTDAGETSDPTGAERD